MPKVILDAGHGGSDIGSYYRNRSEKDDNLRLTLRVGELLENRGVEVAYTRTSDVYLPQLERTDRINQIGGDLLISIHRLSGRSISNVPSLDFYIKENDPFGVEAAIDIADNLYDVGYQNYGLIVRTDIPILNSTDMSGFMLGIGHMESEEENRYFDENYEAIAAEIAAGILDTFSDGTKENFSVSGYPAPQSYRYRVMAGAYRNYDMAQEHQLRMRQYGYRCDIIKLWKHYAVYAGDFSDLDEASKLECLLRRKGYPTVIVMV